MAKEIDLTSLEGFTRSAFLASSNKTHDVYRYGTGPAVIVIHEVPGLTPLTAAFGRKVADRGMTAVMPSLFGTPGREMTTAYTLGVVARACISREFTMLATNKTSPITKFLRELAAQEHKTSGGPGVGVVGMCLTGGFALAMSVDDVVVAPVMSQPGLPAPLGAKRKAATGVSDDDLAIIKRRSGQGLCVMGLRFSGDPASPEARFETLRRELGDNFVGVEVDSSAGNPWGYRKGAHSVLTEDYSDQEGSPTRQALEDVLTFFATRLGVEAAS
ncbi:MAG: dienelactone hydrolase family protein [Acidimicrobiales bacterium]